MPSIDRHNAGHFCWFELATTDQAGAKQFHQTLFGWEVQDAPIGPNELYSSFKRGGRDVAAAYTMRSEQLAHGMPPHWLVYVGVGSADGATKKASDAGGKVLMPPFDVMDLGRMAIIQDPAGASFAVWEPKRHHGTGLVRENGAGVWADLIVPDSEAVTAFYRALFGWQLVAGKSMVPAKPGDYIHIVNGGEFIGGIPPVHGGGTIPSHWMTYFAVADCQATIAQATSMGARVLSGPMTIEGTGTFAALSDPQGAVFALIQLSPPKK